MTSFYHSTIKNIWQTDQTEINLDATKNSDHSDSGLITTLLRQHADVLFFPNI